MCNIRVYLQHVNPQFYDKMTKGKSTANLLPAAKIVIKSTGTAHDRLKPNGHKHQSKALGV